MVLEPQMKIDKVGLDKTLLKKRGNSKTFLGWILQRMQDYRKEKNFEMAMVMETIYKKGLEFQKSEKVRLNQWRGKSGIKLLEYPDRFICITYQKPEPNEEPKEIRKEVLKRDLNDLIVILNLLKNKEEIKTSELAEKYYQMEWKKVFSDRTKHTYLVYMLNILEKKQKIKYYRSGKIKIIKDLDYFSLK